jgi:RNA polymerase sigma-70 factor (ECF subfamily)
LATADTAAVNYAERDPDVRLMLAVRDDDAAAFEQLVARHQSRLLNFLFHLVGDRDNAEDLAQEVFMRVFKARKSYQPGAKFSTWLFTIANNTAKNSKRTLARRKEVQWHSNGGSGSHAIPSLDQLAKDASARMPTRQLDKAERSDVVRLAMQSLSDRQRAAVLLCKFEGMSYAEIADTMELSPSAVKSLLSRARDNLRDILHPYLNEGRSVGPETNS